MLSGMQAINKVHCYFALSNLMPPMPLTISLPNRRAGIKLLTSLILLSTALPGLAEVKLGDTIPVNPDLSMGTLQNGLRYYIQKNDTPRKKVELRLVVKAGSVLEDEDQQGLAHFTEHMAFNGSTHFKKHQLISYLQSIGVKFGADLNAYTNFDETVYILPIPTDKKSYLKTGMQVLADWAQGVQMKAEDIDKERPIILEESRLGKGVDDRIGKQLLPEIFNGSQYAARLPIGKDDIIKSFKHDALRRFYKDWYRPNLMAVMVVGDVNPPEAEKLIHTYFDSLRNPLPERPRPSIVVPKNTASKALVITDKEVSNNMLMLRYPLAKQPAHEVVADYRQDIVRSLYRGMLNRRLAALTDQPKPPFLNASAGTQPVVGDYESFVASAVISPAGTAAAMHALIQEKNRVRQFGFNADELDRAKKIEAREYESMFNESNKSDSANFAAEYIRHFLTNEPIPGIKNEYLYFTEFSPGITLEEMNEFARANTPDDSTKLVFYVGSNKAGENIASSAELLNIASQAEQQTLTANKDKPVQASLMDKLPAPGQIVSEKENKLLGLLELTLSNGLKVTLKKTDFKNDQVLLSARRFGGMSLYPEADQFNAWYANSIAWGMGMGKFSHKEIQETLAGKNANVSTSIDNYTESFGGASSNKDVESMLQLLFLRMTSPRRDEAFFQRFVEAQKELARNNMSSPEQVFWDEARTTQFGQHPRLLRPAKVEDFDHLSLDRSLEIYQQRFGSAKGLHFFIVGSFDMNQIRPLIATYLANLPVTDIPTQFQDLHIEQVKGVVKKDVQVGSDQKSIVSISFAGPTTYTREEFSRFYAMIDILNLKIIDVLREKQGLIYSGGVNGNFIRTPNVQFSIDVSLPCSPENVDKVIAALFAEIKKLQQNGPLVEDLNKIKQNWIKDQQQERRSNENWLNHLQRSNLYQTDPTTILSVDKLINSFTPAQIKDVARRYFDFNNYVQVVMYPEGKKEK